MYSVDISAEGNYLVAGSKDDVVYFFSKDSSTPLWSYETNSDVISVSISADAKYIVAGSGDVVYLFSNDMIDHVSLFGSFSINKIKDVDASLMFNYKKLYPTFYFNFFWATRHTEQNFDYLNINGELIPNITINNDVNYQFVTVSDTTATSDNGIFAFSDILVYEGTRVKFKYTVN